MTDSDLKARFDELRAEEMAAMRAAFAPRQHIPRRRFVALGAVAVLLLVAVSILVRPRTVTFSDDDRAFIEQASAWRPPTDFLLQTPGGEILATTPPIPDLPKGIEQ